MVRSKVEQEGGPFSATALCNHVKSAGEQCQGQTHYSFFHPQVNSRTSSLDSSTNGGSQRSNIKYTSQPSLHSIGNRAREEMMGDHTEETLSNRAHEEMLAGRAREGGHTPPYLPARLDLPKRSQEVATRPDLLLPLPLNVSHQRPSRSNSESKSTRQNNMDIVEVKSSRRPSLCRQEHVRQESVGRPPWFPRESTPQPSEMLSSGVLDFSSPQESRERSSRSRVQVTIVCFFPITLLSLLFYQTSPIGSFSPEPSETTAVPSASFESANQQRLRAMGALQVVLRGRHPLAAGQERAGSGEVGHPGWLLLPSL